MEQYKAHCMVCFSEEKLFQICCDTSILCNVCFKEYNEKKIMKIEIWMIIYKNVQFAEKN